MTDDTRGPGDNNPPTDADPLRERLEEGNRDLIKRQQELLAAIARSPDVCEDDETAGKLSDFVKKQIGACIKQLEGRRVAEKQPFLDAERTVDGFFKHYSSKLEDGKRQINRVIKAYLDEKAARERRRREAKAQAAREEAARQAKAAREAARKIEEEEEYQRALEAQQRAEDAAKAAAKAEKEAGVKTAEMSRVRGDYGSVASLKEVWTFRGLDRQTLDLEALRQHLPEDSLEKALRSFIKAGGRHIRGAEIYKDTVL